MPNPLLRGDRGSLRGWSPPVPLQNSGGSECSESFGVFQLAEGPGVLNPLIDFRVPKGDADPQPLTKIGGLGGCSVS